MTPMSGVLDSGTCPEHVIPIVLGGAQAFDGGIQGGHGAGHILSGGISIKTAVDLATLVQESSEPPRVGPGAGGRDAAMVGMEGEATDRINGGLTEDDVWKRVGGNGEEAAVFLGAGRHPPPGAVGGSTKFSADGSVLVVWVAQQQENGVGPGVGIESAGLMPASVSAPRNSRTAFTPTFQVFQCLHWMAVRVPSLSITRSMPPSGLAPPRLLTL